MGFRAESTRSWSLSRSRLLAECPRGFLLRYYRQHEPELRNAKALQELTTLPMAGGKVVDLVISHTLKSLRDSGEVRTELANAGERSLRRLVADSPAACHGIHCQQGVRRTLPPLVHDRHGHSQGVQALESAVSNVRTCLDSFEHSELWSHLKASDASEWLPLPALDMQVAPSTVTPKGLKIYAAYDFAMKDSGEMVILDWKAGRHSQTASSSSQTQVALYAGWAMREHKALRPLVQVVWLQDGPPAFAPAPAPHHEVQLVKHQIDEDVAREAELVENRRDNYGRSRAWADRMKFPATPQERLCPNCAYLELCPEGAKVTAHIPRHPDWKGYN